MKPIFSFFTILLCLSFLNLPPLYAQTEYSRTAQFLYEIAKEYYNFGDYDQALHEFKKLLLLEPSHEGARKFIELIEEERREKARTLRDKAMAEAIERLEGGKEERLKAISAALEKEQKELGEILVEEKIAEEEVEGEEELTPELVKKRTEPAKIKEIKAEEIKSLLLNEELWQTQPKTILEIELGKGLVMEAKTIARYLVEKPQKIELERVDSDNVIITAKEIGSSFLHLWEDKGRWTFNVKVVSPYIPPSREEILVLEEEPFKISYAADHQSYYRKDEGEEFARRTLSFNQWAQIAGPTPYGEFDASLSAKRYGKEQEITNYTVGLTDGKIGNFKDFSIRGFDFYESFSELSYPGELLKGVLLEGDAFNENIHYSLLRGKERQGYGYLPPGVVEEREAYVEGLSLSLFPYENKTFSFNYARGTGADREDYLRDRIYSFDGKCEFENNDFRWEVAYDEYSIAALLGSSFRFTNFDVNVDFRNIAKDFTTISGRPSNRGEVGSTVRTNWQAGENLDIYSSLDVYRARYNYNEGKPDKLNFDWDSDISLRLGETSHLLSSISYVNEPGLSFPRRYLNLGSTYSTSFEIFDRRISPFVGVGFARSRNPLSASSDYDTARLLGGFRFLLTESLFYRLNYEYNWLEEKSSAERGHPSLLETGVDFRKDIFPSLNVEMRALYRNEENTGLTHAFLSGEDSAEGSLRLNYTPFEDIEFFAEGRVRKVWGDPASNENYLEADFLLGSRCSWDTFFRWNPKGRVSGVVFKDLNSNGKREKDEPFLEGVKVNVGEKVLTTSANGYFSTVVRGKKAMVRIQEQTLPEGHILTTPSFSEVEISATGTFLNFGASSFSAIYGTVFYDVNSNGKLDTQDEPLPNIRLYLEEKPTITNLEGSYYFRHLEAGTYMLKLDLNSVPAEFIPSVPIRKEIDLSEGVNYNYSFPLRKE